MIGEDQPAKAATADGGEARAAFDRLLAALRPKLHRYCARMTGSVVDGEDVVQEALVKAIDAFARSGPPDNPEAWLFRIAHNAALDFLRRRARRETGRSDEDLDMIAEPSSRTDDRIIAAASLRTFMRLPVAQRSSVILMDVLGYSLDEIGGVLAASIPAVKANLIAGGRGSANWRRSPTTIRCRNSANRNGRASPITSIGSTPAISTRSAICSPTRFASTSSPEPG